MVPSTSPGLITGRSPPQRRWIPVTLRILAVILAFFCVIVTFTVTGPLRRQYMTMKELNRPGVSIGIVRRVPAWLRGMIGDERANFFEVVNCVQFNPHNVSVNAEIENLHKLPGVTYVIVGGAPLTDIGLHRLEGMTNLQKLWLEHTQVTNAGVANLQRALPNLKIERGPFPLSRSCPRENQSSTADAGD